MLRPRIIPCLLVHGGGLVKTRRFDDPKYVGDPINAVRIFNEKGVDELMVLDIDATVEGRDPDYGLVSNLAVECRMPLCYGGGVHSVGQVEKIIRLGVEKVALSAAAVDNPALITEASSRAGSQSVVVVIDVKKTGFRRRHEVVTHRGKRRTGLDPTEFAQRVEQLGAGEIVINSVDGDGEMQGYDLELVEKIRQHVATPLTVLGVAGSLADIESLIRRFGLIGAAAGSLFVFKGKYRAVLISYPDAATRDEMASVAR